MILLIGVMDKRMQKYLKMHTFDDNVKVVYKMCNLKLIKEQVKIIIPFGFLMDNGLISNTYVHLYELLTTINVNEINYYNSFNEDSLKKIAEEFNVVVKKIDA